MELLISASFIAAFFAGVAALFAPCCVTVLLPTYFASIFKQRSTIFLMTFVYFLGLLAVFMPIGLGASAVMQLFSAYHNIIFTFGSLFLILLGLTLVFGFQFSFPTLVHPQLKNSGLLSVFVLGVFSGIATTCCAPVLAGVLALAALPASFLLGGAYTLAYVLGMVIPLFILSMFLDKNKFSYISFEGFSEAKKEILEMMRENDIILVKGSQNTLFLERAVEMLLENKDDSKKLCRRGEFWDRKRKESS